MKSDKQEKSSLSYQLKTFTYAFRGLVLFLKTEIKAKFHIGAGIVAIITGFSLKINFLEWMLLVIAICSVLICEIINSTIEQLADEITNSYNQRIGNIKDMAAGGVLLASIMAAIIGLILFIPKILHLLYP